MRRDHDRQETEPLKQAERPVDVVALHAPAQERVAALSRHGKERVAPGDGPDGRRGGVVRPEHGLVHDRQHEQRVGDFRQREERRIEERDEREPWRAELRRKRPMVLVRRWKNPVTRSIQCTLEARPRGTRREEQRPIIADARRERWPPSWTWHRFWRRR